MARDCPFFRIDDLSTEVPPRERAAAEVAIVEGCTHPSFVSRKGRDVGCGGERARCVIAGGYPGEPNDEVS